MKSGEIKRPNILMHIVIIIVAIICGCLMANDSYERVQTYKENVNLKTNYVLEYATIVDYKEFLSHNGYYFYYTYYEYIAPDNTKYTGTWETNIYDEEEAKMQIGKRVPIYVDHELHLDTKNLEHRPSLDGAYFSGIVSVICFVIMIISLVILVRWRRYKTV